jgi:N-acetylglucosaminyldiphosphoundecaprenol N-acetyl-beta-D-mannosaminyltransferase
VSYLSEGIVANHNLHSVYVALTDSEYRAALRHAKVIHADGWPLLLWCRIKYGVSGCRLGYRDWDVTFLSRLKSGTSVMLLGGTLREAETALRRLRERHPNLLFLAMDGYRPEDEYVGFVQEKRPQYIFLGMGMGKQERVARKCISQHSAVYFCAGGWIKQAAALERLAPAWLVRLNAEWLWRLAQDPRAKFRRYLIEPWTCVRHIVQNLHANKDDLREDRLDHLR